MHARRPPDRLRNRGPGSGYAKDHERLLELLASVGESRDPVEAKAGLVELFADLDAHFIEEEAPDGVFTWLATLAPELGPTIRKLEKDHDSLRAEIVSLIDQADAEPPPDGEAFNSATRAFCEHLRRHERQEREVLARAMDV